MRLLLSFCLLAAPLLAQRIPDVPERVRRALVEVRVTDTAAQEAVRRLRAHKKAAVAGLADLRIHQPYTLVVTGVIVSPEGDIVMPALHPRADLHVQVTMHDGTTQAARIRGNDAATNVALIRVSGPVPAHLEFAHLPMEQGGKEMTIAGYERGAGLRPRELDRPGIVQPRLRRVVIRDLYSRRHLQAWAGVLRSVPGARFQCGAACVDENGHLAGLRIGGISYLPLSEPVSLHYFVPGRRLERLVDQLREHGEVPRAYFGVRWRAVPHELRAHFDLSGGAKYVVQIDRNGPAWKAGLRLNDVLLKVNGKAYSHQANLEQALFDCPTDKEAKLTILRRGKPVVLSVRPR